jgi:serine hydrolase
MAGMQLTYAFLPGIGNSEPEHWQAIWANQLQPSLWVQQADWNNPERDAWVSALARQLRAVSGAKLLVAHSLGCLLAAEAADQLAALGVVGAFLVAPPDPESPCFPASVRNFRSALDLRLPVPSMLVVSQDDPYCAIEHAAAVAPRWQSELVNVGSKGHINAGSRLEDWAEGRALLDRFQASLRDVQR